MKFYVAVDGLQEKVQAGYAFFVDSIRRTCLWVVIECYFADINDLKGCLITLIRENRGHI